MDKEEAMKILKDFHDESAIFSVRTALETLHPELKESEDEKIRKEIIRYLKRRLEISSSIPAAIGSWIAWLEKQGDNPIKWNKNTEGNKPQVNHSVLMKTFQGISEGEWKGEYWEQYRWAGIVRDSDVLSWMELSDLEKQGKQKLTLRERYKNIAESEWFKKTHEGMSVSDDEKVDNVNKIEQKPAWSEEDENYLNTTIAYLKDANEFKKTAEKCITWLKSLGPQNTWKPSDEQITVLELASKYERVFTPKQIDILIDLKEQLKKLRGE